MTRADIFDIMKVGNFNNNEKLKIAADLILDVALDSNDVELDKMQDDLRNRL